jgi:large subunit ribosomal protein L5
MVKNGGFANIKIVEGLSKEGDRRLASRLKEKYKNEIVPALMEKFKYSNVMQVPKLVKVILNVSGSEARDNQKVIDAIVSDLSKITGQRPIVCVAKKSVANFKLRVGMKIGAKVTLRQDKMFEFVDKFFNVALPRVRDFRGISANSFDGRGNYNVGVKEQLIFPEIEYEKIDKVRGMDICFVTTARTDEEARELLSLMGAPFTKGR